MAKKCSPDTVSLVAKSALQSWTSLRLAIQQGFVEGNTDEKLAALEEDLVDLCIRGADQPDIEDLFESAAFHDFNFVDEDKSFRDLARAITVCFRDLESGDVEEVIVKHFPSVADALTKSSRGENQIVEVDEESALSEMVCETSLNDHAQREKQEPIIDEDGFQLVQTRRKR